MHRIIYFLFVFFIQITKVSCLDTVYGPTQDTPIIQNLFKSSSFQRLNKIHQYGIAKYTTHCEDYSRLEHSLGVYYLLNQKALASQDECIAGLLHDVSHTVFSHVGDFLYKEEGECYQDSIYCWYLNQTPIKDILNEGNISVEQVNPDHPHFQALETPLPSLCADRIDYNLQGGWRHGLISKDQMLTILNSLAFERNQWYFKDIESAQTLGEISLHMTEFQWGSALNIVTYEWCAESLKRALFIGLISENDIHFNHDEAIWNLLKKSPDPVIKMYILKLENPTLFFQITSKDQADRIVKGKFRGIDPLVKTENGLEKLTDISPSYKEKYYNTKSLMEDGWAIKNLTL